MSVNVKLLWEVCGRRTSCARALIHGLLVGTGVSEHSRTEGMCVVDIPADVREGAWLLGCAVD